jgi:deazaflavin-dependent oxidoreductase (nitroreductase family)
MPVLLLTSRGRRSGQERTSALLHLRDGERFVVIASNAGEDRHPAWWLNLRAQPRGEVELGRHRIAVRAREAEGPERQQLWTRWLEADPSYDEYRKRTTRRIPVVVLERDVPTSSQDWARWRPSRHGRPAHENAFSKPPPLRSLAMAFRARR